MDDKQNFSAAANEVDTTSQKSDDEKQNLVGNDMTGLEGDDLILAQKMSLVNDALDEIGFTPYHLKMFFLNGMGYAVDSQIGYVQSSCLTFVNYQFNQEYASSTEAQYAGLLVGALFWGFSADLIGRKIAFNLSLFLAAIFCIMTGTMGNFGTYCFFVGLTSWAYGGNLVLDTTVFLEYLPHKDQWLMSFFALWWGIGQTVSVLIAWAFLANYSCESADNCPSEINRGWRYTWMVNGALVLVLAVARITIVRLKETPKFLVSNNRDEEAMEVLHGLAEQYNRPCSLTLEQLTQIGEISSNEDFRKNKSVKGIFKLVTKHIKVLFAHKKIALSTSLIFASWTLLGIAYPLYSNFLPQYLASRGANISASTTSGVYRDNVISNVCSIAGPIIAGAIIYYFPRVGRRGTMAIGGVTTMAFLFGYTAVKNRDSNVALSSLAYTTLYIYYGVLYAYSPEVLPTAARATGNALCFGFTRAMGCIVPVIAFFSNTQSAVPIWICGALVGINGLMALVFPFEPSKQRVV